MSSPGKETLWQARKTSNDDESEKLNEEICNREIPSMLHTTNNTIDVELA